MRRVVKNLHVENRGQAAQSLRADAQLIDLFVQLEAEFFETARAVLADSDY